MKTSKEIYSWLRGNLGPRCLGVLTSQDAVALVTSVNLSNLISYPSAPPELFTAYGAIVAQMQPQARYLAYHAIACELDWHNRSMIWQKAGLEMEIPESRCVHEGPAPREAVVG